MGSVALDSKLNTEGAFELQVYREDLQMFGGLYVMTFGGNVLVPKDSSRILITPSGTTKGASVSGGLLKWFGAFVGLSATGQIESSEQKTLMRSETAVTYQVYHVDDMDAFLRSREVVKIQAEAEVKPTACNPEPIREEIWGNKSKGINGVEKDIEECIFFSRQNLDHRAKAAYLYAEYYVCTGKQDKTLLEKSMEHADMAQKNYDEVKRPTNASIVSRKNWDENHALDVLGLVYWNEAAAILETQKRKFEIEFAQKKTLEWMPTSIEEIKRIR
jgi:hypothetical protein